MKEKWETFKETMEETTSMSKKELWLIAAVCVLGGIVFGMLCSPRKSVVIGSNNGNNSGNCQNGLPEEDCDEVEQIGVWEDDEAEDTEA